MMKPGDGVVVESYIVRLDRKDEHEPERISGRVENVARNAVTEFGDMAELMAILVTIPKDADCKYLVE